MHGHAFASCPVSPQWAHVRLSSHSTPAKRTATGRKEEFQEGKNRRKKKKTEKKERTTTEEEEDDAIKQSRANADRPPKSELGNRQAIRRAVSSKAVALTIRPGPGQSYASVASKLKAGADVQGLGLDIRAMKKTAYGDVRSWRSRGWRPPTTLQWTLAVSDLDEETTAVEAREALRGQLGGDDEEIRVVRVVSGFGGGKAAIIRVPRRLGLHLD